MWSALASHRGGLGRVLPTLRGPICPVSRSPEPKDGDQDAGSTPVAGRRCTLSALALVLPQVYATAAVARPVTERKGPHSLRLVTASAMVEPMAPVQEEAQPAGCEFYRKYTEAMLRRYMTMSMEAGRVPSLLGREMFRGNVTALCRKELRGRGDFRARRGKTVWISWEKDSSIWCGGSPCRSTHRGRRRRCWVWACGRWCGTTRMRWTG